MKMKVKDHLRINFWLFLAMVALAVYWELSYYIFLFFNNSLVCFDQLIIPGLLCYWRFRAKWLIEEVDVP
jgi:hypothetical protein